MSQLMVIRDDPAGQGGTGKIDAQEEGAAATGPQFLGQPDAAARPALASAWLFLDIMEAQAEPRIIDREPPFRREAIIDRDPRGRCQ